MENTVISAQSAVALNPERSMSSFALRYAAQSYALMRIVTGFLFFWHGAQKLFSVPMPPPPQVPPFVIEIAGPIELIGGALVMIGLLIGGYGFIATGLLRECRPGEQRGKSKKSLR